MAERIKRISKNKRFTPLASNGTSNVSQQPLIENRKELEELENQEWVLVSSRTVSAIKRDVNDLLIRFNNRSVYKWNGKAPTHYNKLLNATSKGTYVSRNLYGKHNMKIQ